MMEAAWPDENLLHISEKKKHNPPKTKPDTTCTNDMNQSDHANPKHLAGTNQNADAITNHKSQA